MLVYRNNWTKTELKDMEDFRASRKEHIKAIRRAKKLKIMRKRYA